MNITAMFDPGQLQAALDEGWVRKQRHPELPLVIYNYTKQTQYEGVWNDVTRQCRGLIVDDQGEIIARPFPKFFNYGQTDVPATYYTTPVIVTDKYDGSLGIYWEYDGQRGVASRGSFTSEQARHATDVLNSRYPDYHPDQGMTSLFEICFPQNRIVVDYGDFDDLVLLGQVSIDHGWSVGPFDADWTGPRVTVFECSSFQEAIEMAPRPNAEGIVVHFMGLDQRLKIKQADYVALHRILTNTTERSVWEFLAVSACKHLIPANKPQHWGSLLELDPVRALEILEAGDQWMELLLKDVPDEFYNWVHTTIDKLNKAAEDYKAKVTAEALRVKAQYPERRDFARQVSGTALGGLLFQVYDGRDITTQSWLAVYPPPGKPFFAASEDVA